MDWLTNLLTNQKAYVPAIGMLGLGIYQISQEDYTVGGASICGGLTLLVQKIRERTPAAKPPTGLLPIILFVLASLLCPAADAQFTTKQCQGGICQGGVCQGGMQAPQQSGLDPRLEKVLPNLTKRPADVGIPDWIVSATCKITRPTGDGMMSGGSGVAFAQVAGSTLIVTNKHVCPPGSSGVTVLFGGGNQTHTARLVATDDVADLSCVAVACQNQWADVSPVASPANLPVWQVGFRGTRGPYASAGTLVGPGGANGYKGIGTGYQATIWTDHGDSGSGLFDTATGHLTALVWGGDDFTNRTGCIGPADLQRFTSRCFQLCNSTKQPGRQPTAPVSLPPPPSPSPPPPVIATLAAPSPAAPSPLAADVATIKAAAEELKTRVAALESKPSVPGPQGVQGPPGVSGPPGPAGVAGPQGIAGLSGKPGPAGQPGPAGPDGPGGATGSAGADGTGVPSWFLPGFLALGGVSLLGPLGKAASLAKGALSKNNSAANSAAQPSGVVVGGDSPNNSPGTPAPGAIRVRVEKAP